MIFHLYRVVIRLPVAKRGAIVGEYVGRTPVEAVEAAARDKGYPTGRFPSTVRSFARCVGPVGEPSFGACHDRRKTP